MQALTRAADRGVHGVQLAERKPATVFNDLAETPGVEIRIKHETSAPHLKSYQIDGRFLRTGAANFSASGLLPKSLKSCNFTLAKAVIRWMSD